MAKCGSKPRQLSARQLRKLVREEKRALALQRSVRQAPHNQAPPPSPRRKRPSQYHVSLAKKKRVKISPLRPALRRVRTESSIAFSAITESDEIPLFEAIKRESRLIYVPRSPVPLIWPKTPVETSGISSYGLPATHYGYYRTTPGVVSSRVTSPVIMDKQVSPLSTPLASSTPLLQTPHAAKAQPLSPLYLGSVQQDVLAPDKGSPRAQVSDMLSSTGAGQNNILNEKNAVQTAPLANPRLQRISTSGKDSPQVQVPAILSPAVLGEDDKKNAEQTAQQHASSSPLQATTAETGITVHGQVLLPKIRPLIVHRRSQARILSPSQIFTQLPVEQDLGSAVPPRVHFPKKPLYDSRSTVSVSTGESPETSYHRSLMASIWAQPSGLSPTTHQQRAGEILQGCDQGNNTNSRVNPDLEKDKIMPVIPMSTAQSHTTCVPQWAKLTPSIYAESTSSGTFRSYRRTIGVYNGRNDRLKGHAAGAFANAILRQTGHLEKKNGDTSALDTYDCGAVRSELLANVCPVERTKDLGIGDKCMHPKPVKILKPISNSRFYFPRSDPFKTRAPAAPCPPSMDGSKSSLAPAAIIRNDPLRRPIVRPNRKRLLPIGRVLAYKMETGTNGQNVGGMPETVPATGQLDEKVTATVARSTDKQRLPERHWARRVVADGICHYVSTDNVTAPSIRQTSPTWPSRSLSHSSQISGAVVNHAMLSTSESNSTIERRKGGLFTALKAVYNRLWA